MWLVQWTLPFPWATSMTADFVPDEDIYQTNVKWSDIRFICVESSLARSAWSACSCSASVSSTRCMYMSYRPLSDDEGNGRSTAIDCRISSSGIHWTYATKYIYSNTVASFVALCVDTLKFQRNSFLVTSLWQICRESWRLVTKMSDVSRTCYEDITRKLATCRTFLGVSLACYGDVSDLRRKLRESYEETALVEFRLYTIAVKARSHCTVSSDLISCRVHFNWDDMRSDEMKWVTWTVFYRPTVGSGQLDMTAELIPGAKPGIFVSRQWVQSISRTFPHPQLKQ